MLTRSVSRILYGCAIAVLAAACFASPARAQQTEASPETPQTPPSPTALATPQPSKGSAADANPKNDRIFLVIPNYTTVENPDGFTKLTVKQKFALGAEDAFDPYSFLLAGILAGKAQALNDDETWGQGLKGYGKRYVAAFGDASIGSFMTTGVYPSLFHQDPRYFRVGHGGFWRRSGHATKRLFVGRSDADKSQFNYSEFLGNATAAGISLTYHSREEANWGSFGSNLIEQIGIDFVSNQLKEFWPDIRHKLLRR